MFLHATKADATELLIPELNRIIADPNPLTEPFWTKIDPTILRNAQDEFTENYKIKMKFVLVGNKALDIFFYAIVGTAATTAATLATNKDRKIILLSGLSFGVFVISYIATIILLTYSNMGVWSLALKSQDEIIKLLARGACLSIEPENRWGVKSLDRSTPMALAINRNKIEMFRILINRYYDYDSRIFRFDMKAALMTANRYADTPLQKNIFNVFDPQTTGRE